MTLRIFGPGDFRVMPWKNGAGSTTELLIDPPGATLAGGFRWRVSMATVAESGPFSSFPGLDRTLLLLEGEGMELDHGPHGRALLPGPLVPVRFQGEWATSGRLLGGPCLDFNVMSRRDQVEHDVRVIRQFSAAMPLPEAPLVLVYACRGALQVQGGPRLEPGELLRVEGLSGRQIRAAEGPADLVLVTLEPRTAAGVENPGAHGLFHNRA